MHYIAESIAEREMSQLTGHPVNLTRTMDGNKVTDAYKRDDVTVSFTFNIAELDSSLDEFSKRWLQPAAYGLKRNTKPPIVSER